MNTGAVIPAEILSRTDLPIYVKLVYVLTGYYQYHCFF